MTGRKKAKDHFDEVLEATESEDEEVEAQLEAEAAGENASDDEGDDAGSEPVKDPIAKAVAAAEARLRHTHIKPLKAELAQLRQEAGNTKALLVVRR